MKRLSFLIGNKMILMESTLFAFIILSLFSSAVADEDVSVDVSSLLKTADDLYNLAKYEEAISYYDRILEVEADNIEVLSKKGDALASLGNFDQAAVFYGRVINIDKVYVDSMGILYLDKLLELESDPTNVDVLYKKGSALINEENYKDALSNFYEALKIDPNHFQSEIKLKITSQNFTYPALDGFVEAEVHDSNGYLVANIKVRNLTYLNHEIVDKIIDEWPVINIVNRDGKNYEVRQIKEDLQVTGRHIYGGAHHYGIYFPEKNSDFGIMHASYWQYLVNDGDSITLTRTVFRPI